MVVPYAECDAKLCEKKEKFNKKLRAGRSIIECQFGIFKKRFPVLVNGINAKSPRDAGLLIMTLGALNNFIVRTMTPEETKISVIISFCHNV